MSNVNYILIPILGSFRRISLNRISIKFDKPPPLPSHTVTLGENSVLSLACTCDCLFSGSQSPNIQVFRVWDTKLLKCLCVIQSSHDVGDLFSVVYSDSLETLYIGCQNTTCIRKIKENVRGVVYLNSHNGYVYALELGKTKNGEILMSGSGDGDVKVWSIKKNSMELLRVLKGTDDAGILTLALYDDLIFCGAQGGNIKHVRSLMAHDDDVLALVFRGSNLFSGSADGTIKRWSKNFEILDTFRDHKGIVLSLALTPQSDMKSSSDNSNLWLISGANDQLIKFWNLPVLTMASEGQIEEESTTDVMLYALSKWISLQTVSGKLKCFEECLRGAKYLKGIFEQLGKNPLVFGKFVGIDDELSSYKLPCGYYKKKTNILVYGHYDVIDADETKWNTDPFEMFGKDGYIYGRGVSDNKGPMLATIFAASELQQEKKLKANVYFLIEGEEESGSVGFYEALEKSKDLIGEIDVIFVSNSYWLDDEIPCLTYGLRGVIRSTIEITSSHTDLHSGMQGGAISEPLNDMVRVLSKLISDDNYILIPGFYDKVRPVTPSEQQLYEPLVELKIRETFNNKSNISQNHDEFQKLQNRKKLMARWRYPSLTVHKIDVSGPKNSTVIPCKAKANVSMRIVPDQDLNVIVEYFQSYVKSIFETLKTDNDLSITINSKTDWWLGDIGSKYYKATEQAIEQEWGIKPLYIREGGSIPTVRLLEKEFNAVTVHFPMGQSTDQAHLNNERIRLQNLFKGKLIFKRLFSKSVNEARECDYEIQRSIGEESNEEIEDLELNYVDNESEQIYKLVMKKPTMIKN
ncbi:387_t:CDS:10 [Diversispora eburnea]|uniref:387_t:CDS:1 n=1 Tax=Diversispora eburnea TaxID=1213867 RepID=A0A9N8YSL5_9GLOM|nr:387_t:CDS:10 [Diversispora eburnea]